MKDHTRFIQSAELYLQASNLFASTMPLQKQIQACNDELALLITLERNLKDDVERMRDLHDEIFGCKIEIQVLREKARRLTLESRYLRFSGEPFNQHQTASPSNTYIKRIPPP
jgi:hypothetical protein